MWPSITKRTSIQNPANVHDEMKGGEKGEGRKFARVKQFPATYIRNVYTKGGT